MSEHDPYRTDFDADPDVLVVKVQHALGAPSNASSVELRVSPAEADEFRSELNKRGIEQGEVIELSATHDLIPLAVSLQPAGLFAALSSAVIQLVRSMRPKRSKIYVNGVLVKLPNDSDEDANIELIRRIAESFGE